MYHTRYLATVILALIGSASAWAKGPTPNSSDEQFIRTSIESYCDAFNRGDVDTLLTFWSSDADYTDLDGVSHRGKEAIGSLFKAATEDLKGYQLAVKIDALRLVKPEVAIEDGTASLTDPDGETTSGRYVAVWVKDGDKWLISSARELPSDADEATPARGDAVLLKSLEWLVGEWVSEDSGPQVKVTVKWALDQRFLVQNYAVAGDGDAALRVVQWIGLDPATGQLRSWTFDSRGGFGEGMWSREDNTWHAEVTGMLPDGRVGTARTSVHFVDDAHWKWRSTGRDVEGQPMPDVEVQFGRGDKGERASASARVLSLTER